MSDQPTNQPDQTAVQTPDAGAGQPVAQPVTEQPTAAQPFAIFPDAKSFNTKVSREARKLMNEQAKAAGFDDWQHMQDAVGALRQAPASPAAPEIAPEAQGSTPAAPVVSNDQGEAKRLRMALAVASDLNLPTALVQRLQGETAEEMTTDANRLLALFQQTPRGPGIPPVPTQNRPVTFTRTQMQDAKFVREHADELRLAQREGRIVDS